MADFLSAYALTQTDKLAVVDDRPDGTVRTMTFGQLDAASNQLANVLLDLGVRPGESKVVWCGQNSIGLVLMINAAAQARRHRGPAQLPAERRRSRLRHRPQ